LLEQPCHIFDRSANLLRWFLRELSTVGYCSSALNKLSARLRITSVMRNLLPVCALAGALLLPSLRAQPVGSVRRLDPALDNLISPSAKVEKVAGGFGFTEGPLWVRRDGSLLFSDIPNNAIMQWTQDGKVSVFRKPVFAGPYPEGVQVGSNGLTLDPGGFLISAEHGNRRIARTEVVRNREPVYDGPVTILADRYQGKRLNSPNDVISKRSGDIYFTDPPGLYRNYPQGAANAPKQELDFNGLYRITASGKLELLTSDIPFPNGLAFSPDEKKLYVSNTRPEKKWMVYDVKPDGGIANGKVFLDMTKEPGEGVPDGMKVDEEGNLYATGPGGVLVVSPKGKHLGTIQLPETPSNCAFGDADGQTLFITARTSVYRIRLKVPGRLP
jgi:gluconolactonase